MRRASSSIVQSKHTVVASEPEQYSSFVRVSIS